MTPKQGQVQIELLQALADQGGLRFLLSVRYNANYDRILWLFNDRADGVAIYIDRDGEVTTDYGEGSVGQIAPFSARLVVQAALGWLTRSPK